MGAGLAADISCSLLIDQVVCSSGDAARPAAACILFCYWAVSTLKQ